jgi:hypothetical protein
MKVRGWMAVAAAGLSAAALMGAGQPPKGERPARDKIRERMEERDNDPVVQKYREEFKQELKEHPRIAHSLVELHVTKEHLKNAPHDFGGHKAAAIAAVDEAIKQLKEALKFDAQQDAKHEEKHEGDKPAEHEKRKKDK